KPAKIGNVPGVVFDLAQDWEFKEYRTNAGVRQLASSTIFNKFKDNPNDDNIVEPPGISAAVPKNDHIYMLDAPGAYPTNDAFADRREFRANLMTFVRARFDGVPMTHGTNGTNQVPRVQGSRASDFREWHVLLDLTKGDNGKWIRTPWHPPL